MHANERMSVEKASEDFRIDAFVQHANAERAHSLNDFKSRIGT